MNSVMASATNNILNCPVCLDICIPPIFQCENGHIYCHNCHEKLTTCGVCRVKLIPKGIRNLALEQITSEMDIKCKNSELGCELQIKVCEYSTHLLDCKFGFDIYCNKLFANNYATNHRCTELINSNLIGQHLENVHAGILVSLENTTDDSSFVSLIQILPVTKSRSFTFAPIHISYEQKQFILQTIGLNNSLEEISWSLMLIGSTKEASNYIGVITIHSCAADQDSQSYLQWRGQIFGLLANAASVSNQLNRNQFKLPFQTLEPFLENLEDPLTVGTSSSSSSAAVAWKLTIKILPVTSNDGVFHAEINNIKPPLKQRAIFKKSVLFNEDQPSPYQTRNSTSTIPSSLSTSAICTSCSKYIPISERFYNCNVCSGFVCFQCKVRKVHPITHKLVFVIIHDN